MPYAPEPYAIPGDHTRHVIPLVRMHPQSSQNISPRHGAWSLVLSDLMM